jgi:phenylpyruvate tautomerase
MPLIRLQTNVSLSSEVSTGLCADLSRLCAEVIGKPEAYVVAIVDDHQTMSFGGKPGPAAFVEVRSIGGLSPTVNRSLSERICALVTSSIQVESPRVYLNFIDVAASNWGHDGGTFG